VRVVDSRHYAVRGALVSVTGFPASWLKPMAERRTGLDGTLKLWLRPTAKLPLTKNGSLALFVRARRPGGNPFAGISASRIFRVPLGSR
jgi:hypothetical protein